MVHFSESQQFSDFLENFRGNFRTICPFSKFLEFLVEWKATLDKLIVGKKSGQTEFSRLNFSAEKDMNLG